jgi:predicted nucleic acid-binding protein
VRRASLSATLSAKLFAPGIANNKGRLPTAVLVVESDIIFLVAVGGLTKKNEKVIL